LVAAGAAAVAAVSAGAIARAVGSPVVVGFDGSRGAATPSLGAVLAAAAAGRAESAAPVVTGVTATGAVAFVGGITPVDLFASSDAGAALTGLRDAAARFGGFAAATTSPASGVLTEGATGGVTTGVRAFFFFFETKIVLPCVQSIGSATALLLIVSTIA
jgi:hypothetical protein